MLALQIHQSTNILLGVYRSQKNACQLKCTKMLFFFSFKKVLY